MSMDYRKCCSRFWRGALIGTLALAGCTWDRSGEEGKQTSQEKGTPAAKPNHKEVGEASWYGPGFHGKETANGSFNQNKMTTAHPSLPLGGQSRSNKPRNSRRASHWANNHVTIILERSCRLLDRVLSSSRFSKR